MLWLTGAVLAGLLGIGCDNGNGTQTDGGSDAVVDAGPGKASLSDTSVDFGGADCGGQAPAAKTVTLQNTGAGPLTWSAKLEATDSFELSGATGGTVAPGGSATITINAKPIASSATAGQQYLTALTVTTSDPNLSTASVPVSISAQGATLSLVPSVADFGVYTVGQQAPDIALTLVNTGNKDATVAFDTPADAQFTLDWTGAPAGATVAAGGSPMAGLKARFKATNITTSTSFSSIHVTGTGVCGASATKVDLKGQGTNGALVYSPGTLDFGLTDCGTAALTQTFTIANTGNAPLTWTAAMSSGALYQLSGYGGVLFPQTQQVITVIPGAIPIPSDVTANLYGATITLTTNAANDTPHTVTLKETAHGAILTTSTGTLDFTANGKPGDTKTLTINNVGNEDIGVTLGGAPMPPPCPTCPPMPPGSLQDFVITPSTNPTKVVANGNQNFIFDVEPQRLGPLGGAQVFVDYDKTTGVLCKPLPSPVNTTGTISTTATGIDVRYNEACALASGNRAFCWGQADQYLGYSQSLDNTRNFGFPSVSLTATNAQDMNGMCAADTSGSVSCHSSYYGAQTNIVAGASQLVSANGYFCALASGAVSCWKVGGTSATQVVASKATYIAMGGLPWQPGLGVVMNDGSLWTGPVFGPLNPQLGFANIASVAISENNGMCMGSCGHTCALDTSGAVWCVGTNQWGEVNGTPNNPPTVMSPVQVNDTDGVTPISGALGVAAGQFHTCVIRSDNTVVCFGYNFDGELGIGNTNTHPGVVQAGTLNDAQAIMAGNSHTCVLRTGGNVSCWGQNFSAQSAATSVSPAVTSPTQLPYL